MFSVVVGSTLVAVDASVDFVVVVDFNIVFSVTAVVEPSILSNVVGFPVVSEDALVLACEVVECNVVDFVVVVVVDSDVVISVGAGVESSFLSVVVGFPVVPVDASELACEVVECDTVDFVVVVVVYFDVEISDLSGVEPSLHSVVVGFPVVSVDSSVLACDGVECDIVDFVVGVEVDFDVVISFGAGVESFFFSVVVGFPVVSVDA